MIDFQGIAASIDIASTVQQLLPHGTRSGNEWVARNPRRADQSEGSFKVNLNSGAWSDFATDDRGGDIISLVAYLEGVTMAEAARSLNGGTVTPQTINDVHPRPEPRPAWTALMPVPADAPAPPAEHHRLGSPSAVWTYRNHSGETLMFVYRFDTDGGKEIRPVSFASNGTREEWRWMGPTRDAARPLYGLELLHQSSPETPVLIVEGEKTADAARILVGDRYVVMCWLGGGATVRHVDLRRLKGRVVTLLPDFDAQAYKTGHAGEGELMPAHEQPSTRSMLELSVRLARIAEQVDVVPYVPGERESGWDLADGATRADALAILGRIDAPMEAGAQAGDSEPTPLHQSLNHLDFPHVTDAGQPLGTRENLEHLLREYGISAQYNLISKDIEVRIPGHRTTIDNAANASISELTSLCVRNRVPKVALADYLVSVADSNPTNPVTQWIQRTTWDGESRLPALADTIQTRDGFCRGLVATLIRRWLISAVAAADSDGSFSSKGVLVLQGEQSVGKTRWFTRLVPRELQTLTKTGALIDPKEKDTIISAVSCWLVELGELDATFKRDVVRLKAFISESTDRVRRPYAREESRYPRRTVFFGSVNPQEFLVDDTGNVRWWTIPVEAIDHGHDIDMSQLWAEVWHLYQAGESWRLTRSEEAVLEVANESHVTSDPTAERIARAFDWDSPVRLDEYTASEVLALIGVPNPTRAMQTACAKALRELTGAQPVRKKSGRVYQLPPKIHERHTSGRQDAGSASIEFIENDPYFS